MHKHGLKVLGLAVMAAIGLMAFSASAALAANLNLGDEFYGGTHGFFLINNGGTNPSPTGLTKQAVVGTQIGSGSLEIPAKSAEIVCTTGEIESGAYIQNEYENFKTPAMEKGGHGEGTLKFTGCKTFKLTGTTKEEELKSCLPNSTGTITASVLLLVKQHEGSTYLVAVPKVTTKAAAEANEKLTSTFTTLTFPELCSLPSPTKITGSVSVKAPATDSEKPKLAINTLTEQELIGTKLQFGASPAFIKAEAEAALVSKPGVIWGAM